MSGIVAVKSKVDMLDWEVVGNSTALVSVSNNEITSFQVLGKGIDLLLKGDFTFKFVPLWECSACFGSSEIFILNTPADIVDMQP